MAKFKDSEEMLNCFYKYFDSREPIFKIYRTKGEYVPQPPSIVSWAKFLKESKIAIWEDITFNDLKRMGLSDKFQQGWEEIQAVIEQEIVDNSLLKNYDGSFGGRLLSQRHGWDKEITDVSRVTVLGMDAIKEMLDTEPKKND